MSTLTKAAVSLRGARKYRDVNVDVPDVNEDGNLTSSAVVVKNGVTNETIVSYPIVEVVKDGMAFDVTVDGDVVRLVTQLGCGCGGQKPYEADPGYSGRLRF